MAKIIVALDNPDIAVQQSLVRQLKDNPNILFKCGLEFAEAHGPQGLKELGIPPEQLFLDHKWVDIPNTVSGAMRSALRHYKPAIVNVYAMGGSKMMRAAVEMAKVSPNTKVIAVTVPTSMTGADVWELIPNGLEYFQCNLKELPAAYALHLAQLAYGSGCHGAVCSGHEVGTMRTIFGSRFQLIVPGIRPKDSAVGDQKRVMTPKEASNSGANYLVIGRPITEADDPAMKALEILGDIS